MLKRSNLVNIRSISGYDQGYLLVYLLNIFLLTYAFSYLLRIELGRANARLWRADARLAD